MLRSAKTGFGRQLRRALLATGVALGAASPVNAGIVIIGNELPPEPMILDESAKREIAYGEILFSFYSERKFDALTRLLVGKERGLFNVDSPQPELLLGNLYVELGLPETAEAIFDQLLEKDILAQLHAETWFQKAALDYRRGNFRSAARILAGDYTNALPPALSARRHLMLSNIHIADEAYGEALASLHAIPAESSASAFATYNMGVAMIRSGHLDDGIQMLISLINQPEGDAEANALKDRAALTVGLTELRRKNPEAARVALRQVRADGPFSNEALLALGLSNFERGEYRTALPLWLELVRRNSSHPSVQEALLLAPRAYEELNAMQQALAGYQFAAQAFRDELKKVEIAIRGIDRKTWLDDLVGQSETDHLRLDPMAPVMDYSNKAGPEIAYLYQLFASHQFAENFREYSELQRLRAMLVTWLQELPALQQAYANQQAHLQKVMPTVRSRLIALKRQQQSLAEDAAVLASSIPAYLDMKHPEDLASFHQLEMWEMIQHMEKLLSGRSVSAPDRERLRRLRGLLLYDIARDAPQNRVDQQNDANLALEQAGTAAIRSAAVEQLVREAALHVRGNLGKKIGDKEQEIERMIKQTDRALAQLGQMLKNDALRVLALARIQLGNQLGEAHLAMARLQDASVVEIIEKGVPQ